MSRHHWTDERMERLKRLWVDGYSAKEIAEAFGDVSRPAVLGKLDRLGLLNKAVRKSVPKHSRKDCAGSKRRANGRTGEEIVQRANMPTKPLPKESEVRQTGAFALVRGTASLVARDDDLQCWWPCGDPLEPDFHYCTNAKEPSGRYCPEHAALSREKERSLAWYESRREWAMANQHDRRAQQILEKLDQNRRAG